MNPADTSDASFQIIADLLEDRTGQHLTESRRWRVATALSGIFREHGITNIDQLPEDILPELARRRADTKRLSIWCAGCSTGQEVHSIAMMFADAPYMWADWTIDILGTDVSHRAINAARNGVYSQFEVQRGLGITQMLAHFDETSQGWEVKEATRNRSRFLQHNVLTDPPSRSRFDLILCRNVLLYFDQATRAKAFARLDSALADDGFLMLGAGETVVGQTDRFVPSPKRPSLYEPVRQCARPAISAYG